jgi:cholesterol oxidase
MPADIEFDAIIIGSGFGGAVAACRLAEAGKSVLVLERGRRWATKDYPSVSNANWLFDPDHPERDHGWIDMRIFRHMAVALGAGVGGGSLIYANVSIEAEPQIFASGWPAEITYETLKPYYDRVGAMLNVQVIPEAQATKRYQLMQEGAKAIGAGARFRPVPLAVTFDKDWKGDLPHATSSQHSKAWTNPQGQQQGTCVHCGNCDIGCEVKAKNTLDLNYIPLAERHGAIVKPLHVVTQIAPAEGGYRVDFDQLADGIRHPGSATSRRVFLAAGSLGSTELLLRCRDQRRSLPKVSQRLGCDWSSNGDFLTPAFYENRTISPSIGPTITSAIDFLDGSVDGRRFFIEDGGFPNLLGNYLRQTDGSLLSRLRHRGLFRALGHLLTHRDVLSNVMPWFAQGVDKANGRMRLAREWWRPWRKRLVIDWDITESKKVIDAIVAMHVRLSEATKGVPSVPITWTWFKNLVTPHPLGGCNMGTAANDGVVNHLGEVFGYPGLYVVDGAIVPEALGLNPSRTIAALSERISEHVIRSWT